MKAAYQRVPDMVTAAAASFGSRSAAPSLSPDMVRRRVDRGLRRRDIAFLRRVRGARCILLTDQSPYPPGAPHTAQWHVGHQTLAWLDVDTLQMSVYTINVFFAETTGIMLSIP